MHKYASISASVAVSFVVIVGTVLAVSPARDIVGTKYESSISYLFAQRIIAGYPDGTFKPDLRVNRAEFVALVVKGTGIDIGKPIGNCFADVTDQWFAPSVCYAKNRGWVSGYPDGLFRPTQSVNKVEAFAVMVKAYGFTGAQNHSLPFRDLMPNAWYLPSLRIADEKGLIEETGDTLSPSTYVTRGRMSDIVYRFMSTLQAQEISTAPAIERSALSGAARQKLSSQNFTYIGAFRVPKESNGSSRFGYGGGALALNPHGDPSGQNDGYPGSLYIVGHENDQLVAEVNIPVPKKQSGQSVSGLSTASYLHGFADITEGKAQTFDKGNGFRVDGLVYLDAQGPQNTGKLYWTARTYYNVQTVDEVSHGMSDADLSQPNAKGMWRLSNYHGLTTGGYIFSVPSYFSDMYLAGKKLISGLTVQQGVSGTSQGPALFAFAPWLNYNGATPPVPGTALSAQKLTSYPYTGQPDLNRDPPSNFPDYQVPDSWDASAWIYTPTQHAVVVTGHRAMGATYYGDARPNDCTIYKGYHGEPYEPRILFYDPADLALVAQGKKDPETVLPYEEWNPAQYLVNTCMWDLTGAAFDSDRNLFYVLQQNADTEDGEPTPLVYVFLVK